PALAVVERSSSAAGAAYLPSIHTAGAQHSIQACKCGQSVPTTVDVILAATLLPTARLFQMKPCQMTPHIFQLWVRSPRESESVSAARPVRPGSRNPTLGYLLPTDFQLKCADRNQSARVRQSSRRAILRRVQ